MWASCCKKERGWILLSNPLKFFGVPKGSYILRVYNLNSLVHWVKSITLSYSNYHGFSPPSDLVEQIHKVCHGQLCGGLASKYLTFGAGQAGLCKLSRRE